MKTSPPGTASTTSLHHQQTHARRMQTLVFCLATHWECDRLLFPLCNLVIRDRRGKRYFEGDGVTSLRYTVMRLVIVGLNVKRRDVPQSDAASTGIYLYNERYQEDFVCALAPCIYRRYVLHTASSHLRANMQG
jgi:hypothetical protein